MITKEEKITYKLKNASFSGNGLLTDEIGEVVELEKVLQSIFADKEFDLTVSFSKKDNLEVKDFGFDAE